MADVNLNVSSPTGYFTTVMDEGAVAGYIGAGLSGGLFISDDSTVYLPAASVSSFTVEPLEVERDQAATKNFGLGS